MAHQGELFKHMSLRGGATGEIKPLTELTPFYDSGDHRLYVNHDGCSVVHAVAVEVESYKSMEPWTCDKLMVNKLFFAVVYFDGVRHLRFDKSIYCPDMTELLEMLKHVNNLVSLINKGEL